MLHGGQTDGRGPGELEDRSIQREPGLLALPADDRDAAAEPASTRRLRCQQFGSANLQDGSSGLDHAAGDRTDGPPDEDPLRAMAMLYELIRRDTGHDLSQYKRSTIEPRIGRLLRQRRLSTLPQYLDHLGSHPEEIGDLLQELLIGVTGFFRDSQAWVALEAPLARLLASKPDDHVLRAWVPGCSTGEEAYSLAMVLVEQMELQKRRLNVQVFATDLAPRAITQARTGVYPVATCVDIGPKRLTRFFARESNGYRINSEIREMLVFANQNLISDPPFTKLDLLCCRNLLIYLDAGLQTRLLSRFHYALRPAGLLFLGSSETAVGSEQWFATIDIKWKLFESKAGPSGLERAEMRRTSRAQLAARSWGTPAPRDSRPEPDTLVVAAERMLLQDLVPPTVLVREQGEVVRLHGRTGLYLEPARGPQAGSNIFKMAREGLHVSLSTALHRAATSDGEAIERAMRVKSNEGYTAVELRVVRLLHPQALRNLYRIAFYALPAQTTARLTPLLTSTEPASQEFNWKPGPTSARLKHESAFEALQLGNAELRSTNEQLQRANEELQSANEELDTSKEELLSLNEELLSVNAQLQRSVAQLWRTNNDMKNLLNGADIATIFLDADLRIRRFTAQAANIIRLLPTDIDRPIGDLASTLRYDRLVANAREVLRTLQCKEVEVFSKQGIGYLMRISPYRTTDNVIDGLVVTFLNVTSTKRLQEEHRQLRDALGRSPVSVLGQDLELKIIWASGSAFGTSPETLIGKRDDDLFDAADARHLTLLKRRVIRTGHSAREHFTRSDSMAYDVYIEPSRDSAHRIVGISCVITALTPQQGSATRASPDQAPPKG